MKRSTFRVKKPVNIEFDPKYPSSDGRLMAENTLQLQWIITIKGGLESVFLYRPDVFVAGDLLWYPIEDHSEICMAPDAMVVFGRPKGHRSAYVQHKENNIPPQVTFEILSQSNSRREMERKRLFYEEHGVIEYYQYNPYLHELKGWQRIEEKLEPIPNIEWGWKSPLLGVHFEIEEAELVLIGPDGRKLLTYEELAQERNRAEEFAEEEHNRANEEQARAEEEYARAESEKLAKIVALRRAENERLAKVAAEQAKVAAEQAKIAAEHSAENERLGKIAAEAKAEEMARLLESMKALLQEKGIRPPE